MFTEKERMREQLTRDLIALEVELCGAKSEIQRATVGIFFDLMVELLRANEFRMVKEILVRLKKTVHATRADAHS